MFRKTIIFKVDIYILTVSVRDRIFAHTYSTKHSLYSVTLDGKGNRIYDQLMIIL